MFTEKKRNCYCLEWDSPQTLPTTITGKGNKQPRTTGYPQGTGGEWQTCYQLGQRRVRGYTRIKGDPKEKKKNQGTANYHLVEFRAQRGAA